MSGDDVVDMHDARSERSRSASPIAARSSVDYALRTTQQNLVQLSGMADQKANIVLGASSIMLTIIVGVASSSGVTASLASLGAFTAVAAVFALLAVMPSIPKQPVGSANPLFFGDISRMDREEHHASLSGYLNDDERLYDLLITDIWESAQVLQSRKFAFLRVSYFVFIAGLIVTAGIMVAEFANGTI